jgi:methionyl-tRNA formyltransferase
MRIVFMGTPEFAVPSLKILVEHGYNIVGVLTATDKYGGRGNKKLLQSDVKKYAQEQGLHILQPKNLKDPIFVAELAALKADLQVVVAFRMLPEVVWNMPSKGTMNIHGSLLPAYRGAAPINSAVIQGETETGVTSFMLKHAIDTGDMLLQDKLSIGENESAGSVYNRLKILGASVALQSVKAIVAGNYQLHQQDASKVSHAPKIFNENCGIPFYKNSLTVHNFIRGLSPYPTAWTLLDGQKLKIFEAKYTIEPHNLPCGTLVTDAKKYLNIATKDGFISVLNLQLNKRKRMDIKSFLNGYSIENLLVPSLEENP